VALAPFFERVYGAVGGHLAVSRESLAISLNDISVGVHCGAEPTPNDICISEFAINLLARLYPRLSISGPERHTEELKGLALRINPNIEFADSPPMATSIFVGMAPEIEAIAAGASGWVAHLRHLGAPPQGTYNPYASATAAALACAELFRRIFLKVSLERDLSVSLLDFTDDTGSSLEMASRDVGSVIFAGIGAVGNAALWALGHDTKTRGKLILLDPEQLTLFNLQRYVLGTYADVLQPKVELAKRSLAHSRFSVENHALTLEQFAEQHHGIEIPTICISVDNAESRRSAQALLPKLVVNGWTGNQALGVSWHVFSREAACLACLYQPRGQGISATEQAARALGLSVERATMLWVTRQPLSEEDVKTAARALGVDQETLRAWHGKTLGDLYTDLVCGAVPLDVVGLGKVETVPLGHQSALAGVLMAAELLKRTSPDLAASAQSEPLVSWDDVLRPPPTIWVKPRPREPGCICGDKDYLEIFRQKWGISGM